MLLFISVRYRADRSITTHETSGRFPTLVEGAWTAGTSATAREAEAEANKRNVSCFAAGDGSTSFAFENLGSVSSRVETGHTSNPFEAREFREGGDLHAVQGLQEHQEFCIDDQRLSHP